MIVTARYNETVGSLLTRVFGEDSDELDDIFYQLNPSVTSRFLEAGQEVNLPDPETTTTKTESDHVIEVWE
ncbi:tail protein X [Vibrio brasiliensis]|uniref:tail protein X n=1 Tax=Vibrio brasiliensis TaxID=170652 RepID=UPI001EFD9673|nr:tail protein X [Vibrio brasiliensis]MCG9785382.1 tail protein X [Vibrio brasiliensis]